MVRYWELNVGSIVDTMGIRRHRQADQFESPGVSPVRRARVDF